MLASRLAGVLPPLEAREALGRFAPSISLKIRDETRRVALLRIADEFDRLAVERGQLVAPSP